MIEPAHALAILASAEVVCPADTLQRAIDRVALEITAALADRHPLVLSIMGGAVVFTGQLLPRLRFPLEFDYLHASRYRGTVGGPAIEWRVRPTEDVRGRVVLVVDDILDEGHTLAAVRDELLDAGAAEVRNAVLCEKRLDRVKPIRADFVGLTVPDRYVFGFGMDVHGAWRNLPAIYAVAAGSA
ncbi:MAG: hypoxanthine-guanine phosphoribosyltransferase [Burkholderiales bacterium]|nr:hypoxanthine-guanine phosphoribosyltransferase [Burkholderiales bacterium]